MGIVFEFAVGLGKVLVCMTDLNAASEYIEGKAFRNTLYSYIQSTDFAPSEYLTWEAMVKLFHETEDMKDIKGVKNNSDYRVQ